MSYHRKHALGASLEDVVLQATTLLGKSSTTAAAASKVLSDPYWPELTCQILRLSNIKEGKPAGRCRRIRPGLPGGIGLKDALPAVRFFVKTKQKPWLLPAIAIGVLGSMFAVGYAVGAAKRKP